MVTQENMFQKHNSSTGLDILNLKDSGYSHRKAPKIHSVHKLLSTKYKKCWCIRQKL